MISYQNVIGKYLYTAAIRLRSNAWNKIYRIFHKKQICKHLVDMKALVYLLENNDLDQIRKEIFDYAKRYIGETPVILDCEEYSEEYHLLNQFMISLLDFSIKETNKKITDWKRVAHKLDLLHNLPKVYLSFQKEDGFCNRISIDDAFSFACLVANKDEKDELVRIRQQLNNL